jgi:hypothetical protein
VKRGSCIDWSRRINRWYENGICKWNGWYGIRHLPLQLHYHAAVKALTGLDQLTQTAFVQVNPV